MFKFQAVKKEKALYRVGQRVTCDYYPGVEFKVTAKDWDCLNGTVCYSIDAYLSMIVDHAHFGIKQKYLNKAKSA